MGRLTTRSQPVVLALAGIYAVMSYSVIQWRREMSVRIALGARTVNILALVLRYAVRLTLSGLTVGCQRRSSSAVLLPRFCTTSITPNLHTCTVSGAALLALTLAAAFVPALRAARVDPIHALRTE